MLENKNYLNNNESLESKNKPQILDVNWNILYVLKHDWFSSHKLQEIWKSIFKKEKNIDSIIFLEKIGDETYSFKVYERDNTFSSLCWNWAWAWITYLWLEKCDFVNIYWETFNVSKKNWEIHLNIDFNRDYKELKTKEKIEFSKENILNNIEDFLSNPEKLKEFIWNDTNQITYFLNLFSNLKQDSTFIEFIESLKIINQVEVLWEPHILIEIWKNDLNPFFIDYYIKWLNLFLKHNLVNKSWVNYMFYTKKDRSYTLYPSERWVNNQINIDQTLSCWSWTMALWWELLKDQKNSKISIKQRSQKVLQIEKKENTFSLIYSKNNISNISPSSENQNFFQIEAIYENLRYNMLKYFNLDILNFSYSKIIEELDNDFPQLASKLNKKFWNIMYSSCMHEQEFPIDPYKITSSINASVLADKLDIEEVYTHYLDTLKWDLKFFPNISLENWKVFKEIKKMIPNIVPYSKSRTWLRDFLHYTKNRLLISLEDEKDVAKDKIKSKEVKQLLNELEWRLNTVLWFWDKNILNTKYWKFLIKIYEKLWIYEDLVNIFPELSKTDIDKFLIEIYSKKLRNWLTKIYFRFITQLLKQDFEKYKNNPDYIDKFIYKSFQDSVVSLFIKDNLTKNQKDLLRKKWILNANENFDLQLSSLDKNYLENMSFWLKEILEDDEFWYSFFKKYLLNISKANHNKPVLLWKYNNIEKNQLNYDIYFINWWENWEHKLIMWQKKDSFEISFDDYKDVISNPENIVNVQWAITLMICNLWLVPLIGSERWYREILVETLQEHFSNKKNVYIDFIKYTRLFSDYVPSKTISWDNLDNYYYNFPSWSDNSYTWDLFIESIISDSNFALNKSQVLFENNLSQPTLSEWDKIEFLLDIEKDFDIYNFDAILDRDLSNCITQNNEWWIKQIRNLKLKLENKDRTLLNIFKRIYIKYMLLNKIK